MATSLRKGQKADLTKGNSDLSRLLISLDWQADYSIELDTSAFLLSSNGRVATDSDFVFYGNPNHSSSSVKIQDRQILVDLERVPSNVDRIAITLTIYSKHNFSQVNNASIKVNDLLLFKFGEGLSVETAVVVAEVYRHKGDWKFNAVGAGFSGGLEALCKNFGVDVSDVDSTPPPLPHQPTPPPTPKKVKLDKIVLKKGQKVNLTKKGDTLGEIVINLNWSQQQSPKPSGGFFSRIFSGASKSGGVDLDLGCLFELKDGYKGVVQALGNAFGNLNKPPYIALDGDDRTGSNAAGETIRVNGKFAEKIKRILIFTFIYDGVANWQQVDGVVTVKCPGSPDIVVKMDEYGSNKRLCGIALIENTGSTFSVEKIVRFFNDQKYLDEAFNWGLRWTVGSKD